MLINNIFTEKLIELNNSTSKTFARQLVDFNSRFIKKHIVITFWGRHFYIYIYIYINKSMYNLLSETISEFDTMVQIKVSRELCMEEVIHYNSISVGATGHVLRLQTLLIWYHEWDDDFGNIFIVRVSKLGASLPSTIDLKVCATSIH